VEKESVDEGASVASVNASRFTGGRDAGAGVHHHAGGFVDDREVLVFVEDV
jgi:hypothetical protein